ncbi:MAG: MBL fold metallo-hydrolase [Christensenellales bacterium]|jgi:phosphoribosyl 1,2-cyclic phosphate phosphodiesterase
MKLKYLGTGASEGIPGVFCPCPVCENARLVKGREIRTRSGALLDDWILIDLPPDTYAHALTHGIALGALRSLLVTHSHHDHFAVREIEYRHRIFANLPDDAPPLVVYGNSAVGQALGSLSHDMTGRVAYHQMKAFETTDIDGYRITPLPADHNPAEDCFIYYIERDGRRLLYAHDTGEFPEAVFEWLAGRETHLVSLDCTLEGRDHSRGHMGFPANMRMRDRMRAVGAAHDDTVFVSNHFSHNGGMTHAQLVDLARPEGFLIAWDGLELTV